MNSKSRNGLVNSYLPEWTKNDSVSNLPIRHAENFLQWNVEGTMTHFACVISVLKHLKRVILPMQCEELDGSLISLLEN